MEDLKFSHLVQFSRSVMSNSETPWTAAHQASLSVTSSQSLLKFMSIESEMPSNHLILCCPLLRTRLLCPPLSPWICSDSCPLSQWCCLTISSSATPFSFCLQSFPVSESFPTSPFFASRGQSTRASASGTVLPMNIQDWFPLGWTGWISLQFKGLSRVFSTPQFRSINSSALSFLYSPTLTSIHDYWKNHSFD